MTTKVIDRQSSVTTSLLIAQMKLAYNKVKNTYLGLGVKHIVAIARNSGQLAINPFAGYLISLELKDRGFLTKDELNLLVNTKMKNAQYELVRDV